MISRLSYRARQFRRTLTPGISEDDLREAESALGGDLYALFAAMQPADQRHCLDVYRRLRAEGEDDSDVLAVALIHDAGKGGESAGRIRTWHRVAYVILDVAAPTALRRLSPSSSGLSVLQHHPQIGARLAESMGASPKVVQIIRDHEQVAHDDPSLAQLRTADDDS